MNFYSNKNLYLLFFLMILNYKISKSFKSVNFIATTKVNSYYSKSFQVSNYFTCENSYKLYSSNMYNINHLNITTGNNLYSQSSSPRNNNIKFPKTFSDLPKRKDNILEKCLIFLLSYFLLHLLPNFKNSDYYKRNQRKNFCYLGMEYNGFVDLTKSLLGNGISVEQIKCNIVSALKSLFPSELRVIFKKLFTANPRWICEKSSEFMSYGLLDWLVGPSERFSIVKSELSPSINSNGENEWSSGVKIKECRYLMESGCKSACLYLCKGPTQKFFLEELNIPLHMKPDFETYSCEMRFGVLPPDEKDDPVYSESCFLTCNKMYKKH